MHERISPSIYSADYCLKCIGCIVCGGECTMGVGVFRGERGKDGVYSEEMNFKFNTRCFC